MPLPRSTNTPTCRSATSCSPGWDWASQGLHLPRRSNTNFTLLTITLWESRRVRHSNTNSLAGYRWGHEFDWSIIAGSGDVSVRHHDRRARDRSAQFRGRTRRDVHETALRGELLQASPPAASTTGTRSTPSTAARACSASTSTWARRPRPDADLRLWPHGRSGLDGPGRWHGLPACRRSTPSRLSANDQASSTGVWGVVPSPGAAPAGPGHWA